MYSQQNSETKNFIPLLSKKDGKARLTYIGYTLGLITWKKYYDGSVNNRKNILKLVFACVDINGGADTTIAITCDPRLKRWHRITKVIKILGYKKLKGKINSNLRYNEMSQLTENERVMLLNFLHDNVGNVYKAYLEKIDIESEYDDNQILWTIKLDSLEPLKDKEGKQKKDCLPADIGLENIKSPRIDYEVSYDDISVTQFLEHLELLHDNWYYSQNSDCYHECD